MNGLVESARESAKDYDIVLRLGSSSAEPSLRGWRVLTPAVRVSRSVRLETHFIRSVESWSSS